MGNECGRKKKWITWSQEEKKREGEGKFFMNVIRKGWRRVFGILFAFRFKFVYTKSESDFLRTSIFFKLTIYKGVVSYTKVVLLQKTSFMRESQSGSRAQVAAMLPVCTMYDHLDRYKA